MARGTTLQQLTSDLRDELRRANNSAASPDDVPSLHATINHVYAVLYAAHDWPHLVREGSRTTMSAGQRHYDLPSWLDPERIIDFKLWWDDEPYEIERGISIEDYGTYDPEVSGDRASPALKWDIRFTGTTEQIQFWPTPDDNTQKFQIVGIQKFAKLVNNTDTCRLDDTLVVLYAAAELLGDKSPDKKAKLELAQAHLAKLKVRGTSGSGKVYRMGLGTGGSNSDLPYRAVVRIGR